MSENLKKLREEQAKKVAEWIKTAKPKTVEEIESKIEETREEESKIKSELEKNKTWAKGELIEKLKEQINSEFQDGELYYTMSIYAEALGFVTESQILRKIGNDEHNHKRELERIWRVTK